jgi:hypothetical protein
MCGILGVVATSPVNQLLYDGLLVLQHRGQDAAGIATGEGNRFHMHKASGMVRDVFRTRNMRNLSGNMGIAHCRYPTAGSAYNAAEAQPFYVNSPYGIVLGHNGNLTNSDELKRALFREDLRHVNTNSDSEVLLNVLAHELVAAAANYHLDPSTIFAAVSGVHRRCRGAYAVVAMIAGYGLIAFRDPYGIRPLVFGKVETEHGVEYLVASESVALDTLGFKLVRDVAPGEAILIEEDGTFRALRIDCVDDYGAYLQFGTGTHGNGLSQIVGPYQIKDVEYSLHAVLTHKNQQGAYRGFGAEVSNWMLERLVDMAARDLDMDRVEIRRRNLITPDQFPYRTPTGNIYDSGSYQGVLEKVLELGDYEHWVSERDKARAEGRHVGIGVIASNERSVFSSTEFWFWFDQPEFTPTSSPESASLQIDPTGQIIVTLHSQCLWGNSPETVVSQVVAEEFDVDPSSVVVTYADSQHALPGTGPGGSRFTVMVAGAVAGAATEVKKKIKRIASHSLEVSGDDLEFQDGGVNVVGSPERKLSLAEIALAAYMFRLDLPADVDSGLAAQSTYDHPLTTNPSDDRSDLGIFYPFVGHAWHIGVVEVDDVGRVEVRTD